MSENIDYNLDDLSELRKNLRKEQQRIQRQAFLKNKLSVVGLVIIAIMLFVAIFAPMLTSFSPNAIMMKERLQPSSMRHWFGTDEFGRDVFSRVLYGARTSLVVGFFVSLCAGMLGFIIGLYASFNKKLDNLLMRLCDGIKAIPGILLAICLMAVLGADTKNVIISLSLVSIPEIAYITRSSALVVQGQTYIEAMYASGASSSRVLWKHVAPNILSPLIIKITFVFASTILAEASLSFLGAGVPLDVPSWGSIMLSGLKNVFTSPHLIVFPGIFIALSVLGLNLLGDGLRDFLDPLTK